MNETYSVELRGLTKRFEAIVAVDNVSLDIREGEFLTLLGPSGCGKTTTLRMIAGFEQPDEGEIVIQGERMGRRPPFQRNVNTVFQNYALFPHLDVFSNVAFGLRMRGIPKREQAERVAEALRLVRLTGYERRRSHQLSGGEQQRVALARALVNHPAVLLLDEPLGALDLKLRKAMQLELKSLNREVGITFIYVTHDQEEALVMSDRIAVMSQGCVLQVGAATEIYERPNSRFVADFIGESNFLFGRLEEVQGDTATVTVEGVGILRAVAPPISLERNAPITLAVRPEKMAFVNGTAPPGLNVMTGTVVEVVYRGEDTEYRVTLLGGASVRVRAANQGSLYAVRPRVAGEEVHVAWMPESGAVLGD